jgi:hypothetical protein
MIITQQAPQQVTVFPQVPLSEILTPGEGAWTACAAYCEAINWHGTFQISEDAQFLILIPLDDDEQGIDPDSFLDPEDCEWLSELFQDQDVEVCNA